MQQPLAVGIPDHTSSPPRIAELNLQPGTQSYSSATIRLGGDELPDENCGVVGILFRKEVATLHRLPVRLWSPLPPNSKWTAVFFIESVERATLGPYLTLAFRIHYECHEIRAKVTAYTPPQKPKFILWSLTKL